MNKELHEHHDHEHEHHHHHDGDCCFADMTTSMTTMSITTLQRIFRQTTRQRFIPLKIWVVPTVPQRWRAGLTS